MKRTIISVIALFAAFFLISSGNSPIETYIRKWAPVAVEEMYRSGVPASITLAQGILESRYGQSQLASEGNNHFGIKCHKDWKGKTMAYDDDAKGECFRVYDSAEESFRDHSDFLRYRDRYKFLFEFDTKDYKSWAYGLKKAGYATDPNYPAKLIKYIEDYGLSRYDSMTLSDFDPEDEYAGAEGKGHVRTQNGREQVSGTSDSGHKDSGQERKKSKTSRKERRQARQEKPESQNLREDPGEHKAQEEPVIPESPLSIEEPVRVDKSTLENFKFSLSREVYSRNGVSYVLSVEGETYESIARSYNLFPKEILRFNDLQAPKKLLPGTIVYIQAKKNQCRKGLDKYIVGEDCESLWEICQRFGVKMSSINKLNGFEAGHTLGEGDTILLRGRKASGK
ncbi:MAG: glucosaminidase domain-containing protein [Candidatus Cryptobacteroides sp.]